MTTQRGGNGVPTYTQVLRTPRFLPIFAVSTLSQWGDFIAMVTIAAVVFERTGSSLATATTIAVSILPKVFGRSLLGPLVDRIPYRDVLVASHLLRAVAVLGLVGLVATSAPLPAIFLVLFLVEVIGGAATSAAMVLMTDLFADRRLYAKAMGLTGMSQQLNQALGLTIGGAIVALLGARTGLLVDLATFLIAATVMAFVVERKDIVGDPQPGIAGFVNDLVEGVRALVGHPVLARLVLLSMAAGLGISAPEALAIPLAGDSSWGGALMATPIVGAVVGILVMGRRDIHRQTSLVVPLALLVPVPLLATALPLPLTAIAVLWFVSGTLQAFMIPLQATFNLVTEPAMRGRIFSLGGSLSVLSAAISFLFAGWVGQVTTPALGVTISAAVCLGLLGLVTWGWPSAQLQESVTRAFDSSPATPRAAATQPSRLERTAASSASSQSEPAGIGVEPTSETP